MMNYEIQPAKKEDYHELIQLWERSVTATHHFLTPSDIDHYKPLILNDYFNQLQLFHIKQNNKILGFVGLEGKLIQMLFIDPESRGLGLGKTLVEFAIENYDVNNVDVNEQNSQALGFYKHLGFEITERSETDAAGKPYPVLSMQLKQIRNLCRS